MKNLILPFFISTLLISSLNAQDLILTAVYDGPLSGGTPKGVELYVVSNIADLSKYALGSANNGGGTDGAEYTLSGTASAGDFLYISSESTQFNNFFGFTPTATSGVMGINGDDAIELFFDADDGNGMQVVDVFGDINTDGTNEAWEYMDGWHLENPLQINLITQHGQSEIGIFLEKMHWMVKLTTQVHLLQCPLVIMIFQH